MPLIIYVWFMIQAPPRESFEPTFVLRDFQLPTDLPVTQQEVLRFLVPQYEQKLARSKLKLADRRDAEAWWNSYEAAVVEFKRTGLGVKGEDFLIVTIHEIDTPCTRCHSCLFGGVDLKRKRSLGAIRVDPGFPTSETGSSLEVLRGARPWRIRFRSIFPSSGPCLQVTELLSSLIHERAGAWHLRFGPSQKHTIGDCDNS
jgi:hypothetical protein